MFNILLEEAERMHIKRKEAAEMLKVTNKHTNLKANGHDTLLNRSLLTQTVGRAFGFILEQLRFLPFYFENCTAYAYFGNSPSRDGSYKIKCSFSLQALQRAGHIISEVRDTHIW